MSAEAVESEKKGDGTLLARVSIQKHIMDESLGLNATDDQKFKWIEENSEKFGDFFDGNKSKPEFIALCTENPGAVTQEYRKYIESQNQPIAA